MPPTPTPTLPAFFNTVRNQISISVIISIAISGVLFLLGIACVVRTCLQRKRARARLVEMQQNYPNLPPPPIPYQTRPISEVDGPVSRSIWRLFGGGRQSKKTYDQNTPANPTPPLPAPVIPAHTRPSTSPPYTEHQPPPVPVSFSSPSLPGGSRDPLISEVASTVGSDGTPGTIIRRTTRGETVLAWGSQKLNGLYNAPGSKEAKKADAKARAALAAGSGGHVEVPGRVEGGSGNGIS